MATDFAVDLKMTEFSEATIIKSARKFAWTGMVSSVLIIGSLIFTPLALGTFPDNFYEPGAGICDHSLELCGSLFGVVSAALLIMFSYSFKLWKTITGDDIRKIKEMIKTGCYVIGGLELLIWTGVGVVTPIFFIINEITDYYFIGLMTIPIIIAGICVAATSLMIHGVRKFKPSLVHVYIFWKMLFGMISILPLLLGINMFLFCGFFYLYSMGFVMLQFDIMHAKLTSEKEDKAPVTK